MTTLNFNAMDFNIVYVDPTIGTAGTGETPATALKTLPNQLVNNSCYLIRRSNSDIMVDLPEQTNTTLINCILMGMPTSDQIYYSLLPVEVTSVWTDSYPYANVRCNMTTYSSSNTKASLFINNIVNFYGINCYFFRDGNGGSASNYCNPIFLTNRTDYLNNFTFDCCKFGYYGYDFESSVYRANNSEIATDTSKYPQRKCSNYFLVNYINTLTLNHCVINHVFNGAYSTNYFGDYLRCPFGIMTTANNIFLYKTDFYSVNLSTGSSSSSYKECGNGICVYGNNSSSTDVHLSISKCSFNEILYTTNYYNMMQFIYSSVKVKNLVIADTTVKYLKMKDAMSNGISTTADNAIFSFSLVRSYNINNLTADGITEAKVPFANILYFYDTVQLQNGIPLAGINNIKVNLIEDMSQSNVINSATNPTDVFILNFNNANYISDNATSGEALSQSTNGNCGFSVINSNIEINAKHARALRAQKYNFKGLKIRGYIYFGSWCTADFDSLYNEYGATYGMYLGATNYIRIREYIVNKENPDSLYQGNEQVYIDTRYIPYGNTVWVDSCNCTMFSNVKTSSFLGINRGCVLASPNYITTGQYFMRNQSSDIVSYNVTRQESTANASLKFSNSAFDNSTDYLILGQGVYKGIQINPSSVGNRMLTIYLAFDNIEIPYNISNYLNFSIVVPEILNEGTEDETVIYEIYNNKAGIMIPDTTSTWINSAATLQKYKIQIPITVNTLNLPVEVKIGFAMYTNLGSIYVDPDINIS